VRHPDSPRTAESASLNRIVIKRFSVPVAVGEQQEELFCECCHTFLRAFTNLRRSTLGHKRNYHEVCTGVFDPFDAHCNFRSAGFAISILREHHARRYCFAKHGSGSQRWSPACKRAVDTQLLAAGFQLSAGFGDSGHDYRGQVNPLHRVIVRFQFLLTHRDKCQSDIERGPRNSHNPGLADYISSDLGHPTH
jgi:hypothetical protein